MSEHVHAIEHKFLDISKNIKSVFPNLEMMWILHEAGARSDAIKKMDHKFKIHSSGRMMLKELDKTPDSRRFVGIACAKDKIKKSLLPSSSYALACFFVDIETIENEQSITFQAYRDLYQVLNIFNPDNTLNRVLDIPLQGFVPASDTAEDKSLMADHLGGDVFSALMAYFEGSKQAVYDLAKHRVKQIFRTQKDQCPENKIFPVMADAVRLLIEEYAQAVNTKKPGFSPLFPAFSMTREIVQTFPKQSVKSWRIFCRQAQMMAWSGHDPETILGAAVFYTEDAFIRVDAHLACDTLGMRPQLMTRFDFYNSFADDELNERRHVKLCHDYFDALIMKSAMQNNIKVFTERIHRQNENFLLGTIMGWCCPALIRAVKPLQKQYSLEALQESQRIFKEELPKTSWTSIKQTAQILFEIRRKKGKVSISDATTVLKQREMPESIIESFEF